MKKVKLLLLLGVAIGVTTGARSQTVSLSAMPSSGPVPLTVNFQATCPTCLAWVWYFGDGSGPPLVHSLTQKHTYQKDGTFYVIFAGTDKNGASMNAQATITVNPTCPSESIWSKLQPSEYYNLPAWYLAQKPVPLTWIQPADVTYQSTEFQTTHFNITSWAPTGSGGDIVFQAVNTLGINDFVKLSGFQVSTFFNNQTVEVLDSTPTSFTAYFAGATGISDHGTAAFTFPTAIPWIPAEMLAPINTGAGDRNLYCQWLLVQGGTPPYTYSGSGLPPGLAVAPNGLYSGVSTTSGLYKTVTFCAKDSTGQQVCTKPRWQHVCDGGKTACILDSTQ
jgi:PKD repeat protein